MSTETIRDLALKLPPQERAALIRDLLDSLHTSGDEGTDPAWLDEIDARAEAYEAGELVADDWQVSLERVRQRLHEDRKP
jgi:putative addiction module component (TIGR02574 family)